MISRRQIRAARALLDWSQQDLADRSSLSIAAVKRLELGVGDPRPGTLHAVKTALEAGGVDFTPATATAGEGVRISQPA